MNRTRIHTTVCMAIALALACTFPPSAMPLEWGGCPTEWTAPPVPPVNVDYDFGDFSAIFLAPAAALQSALPTTELPVLEIAPGVGLVIIDFYQHKQPPIEPYNELAISIPVLDESLLRGFTPVYVLYLPVTTVEAMTAGIQGWGYPKTLAKIKCHEDSREGSRGVTCKAKADDLEILTLELNTGNLNPAPPPQVLTFTVKEDLLVKTYLTGSGTTWVGTDYGGAKLILGDHPIGQHLQALGVSSLSIQHKWATNLMGELHFPHACAPLY